MIHNIRCVWDWGVRMVDDDLASQLRSQWSDMLTICQTHQCRWAHHVRSRFVSLECCVYSVYHRHFVQFALFPLKCLYCYKALACMSYFSMSMLFLELICMHTFAFIWTHQIRRASSAQYLFMWMHWWAPCMICHCWWLLLQSLALEWVRRVHHRISMRQWSFMLRTTSVALWSKSQFLLQRL